MERTWESVNMEQELMRRQLAEKYFEPDVTINTENLKGPSWLATLLLWPGPWTQRNIVWQQVCREGQALGRPLAQPEVDALSEVAAWQFRFRGFGQPLSVLVALGFVWKGRASYKIAFRPLRQDVNPNVFPSAKRPWFQGKRARYAWRFTQFLSYAPPSWLCTSWVMNEIAMGKGQTKRKNDQRLIQYNADRKEKIQKELEARFRHVREQQAQGAPMHGGSGTRPQPRPPLLDPKKPGENVDDASPVSSNATGSDWGNLGATPASTSDASSSYPSSSASPYPQQQQSPAPSYQNSQISSNSSSGGWGNSSSAFDDNDDDDMSPVSPAARRREAAAVASSGGSAWDRIRQQSAPQNGQQQQQQFNEASDWGSNSNTSSNSGTKPGGWGAIRQQNQSSTAASTGDSYTYSEADVNREKRNYERERAQKEFDEMVERERQGKGGSGGSGSSGGSGGWFGRS